MDDNDAMTAPPAARPLRRVVLGLTGGIAAYKAAELTRLLLKIKVHGPVNTPQNDRAWK